MHQGPVDVGAVLHLSDLHFGTESTPVVHALIAFAHSIRERLDAIVLSGDLTQRARPEQFAAADAFMAQLPQVPTFVVPGNHDIALFDLWQRLMKPYARHAQLFGAPVDVSDAWSTPDWFLVTLNSTRWWRHKHGEISDAQIRRVSALLERSAAQQVRLLVLHHPLAVPAEAEANNRVRHRDRAVRCWAHSGVDAVLGGHIHWPCVVRLAAPRRCWSVLAGTAVSTRTRRGLDNSVNLMWREKASADAAGLQLVVERWDYLDPESTGEPYEPTDEHVSPGTFTRRERRDLLLER